MNIMACGLYVCITLINHLPPPDYGDWTEDNIAFLKEGLRKFGRAWGKVYREVGGSKTATQCKMFYDEYCKDLSLGLQESLLEHSRMKVGTRRNGDRMYQL